MNAISELQASPRPRRARRALWWSLSGDVLFTGVTVVVVLLRLYPLLSRHAPTGNDWAEMLLVGHAYLGQALPAGGATYPPLVPLLVVAATTLFPTLPAIAVLGALASASPAAGLYIALRPMNRRILTALGACLLLLASSSAEQAVWGGVGDLVGTTCLPMLLVLFMTNLVRPTRGRLFAFGAVVFLLTAASYLSAAEAVPVLLVGLVVTIVLREPGHRREVVRRLPALAAAAAPTLVLAPVYVRLLTTVRISGVVSHSQAMSVLAKFNYVFREDPKFWAVCIAVAAFTPLLAIRQRHRPEALYYQAGAAFVMATAAIAIAVPDIRFFYLVPAATAFGIALWLASLDLRPRDATTWVIPGLLIMVLAVNYGVEGAGAFRLYPGLVSFYGDTSMSPQLLQAVDWLHAHAGPRQLVAVSSIQGSPIGWWVEGLAERPALVEANPQFLYLKGQRRADTEVHAILSQFPSTNSLIMARQAGVSYILMARASGQYHPGLTEEFIVSHAADVAFANQGALIIRVPGPG